MTYLFKQALHVPGKDLSSGKDVPGKDFPRGVHEVPEHCENHPHFLKYVGLGLITEAPKLKSAVIQNERQRAEKLMERLVKKTESKKPKAPEVSKEAEEAKEVLPEESESKPEVTESKPEVTEKRKPGRPPKEHKDESR